MLDGREETDEREKKLYKDIKTVKDHLKQIAMISRRIKQNKRERGKPGIPNSLNDDTVEIKTGYRAR